MKYPLQQSRFRRISASAVKASEKSSIIANKKSTIPAFQRAIVEVSTLPLSPQRVAQKANLSFKNKFHYFSVTDEASDFEFGKQLGFAQAHHRIPLEEKWVWPWAKRPPRNLGIPF